MAHCYPMARACDARPAPSRVDSFFDSLNGCLGPKTTVPFTERRILNPRGLTPPTAEIHPSKYRSAGLDDLLKTSTPSRFDILPYSDAKIKVI